MAYNLKSIKHYKWQIAYNAINNFDVLSFDTLEQAEAKIAEFKAEEEKKELLKNPKIIKYV